jgi:hypothetical protein
MQQPDAEGDFTKHNAPEPPPARLLDLLRKLETVCAAEVAAPPIQPEQSVDGDGRGSLALNEELAGTQPAHQSLVKLLAQLEERNRTDMELRRCYGAIDRALAEFVRHRLDGAGDE